MSQGNVEAIRLSYVHFNRTGEPPWELFDPDAEFDASQVVGFGVIKGRDRVLSAMRDYAASFSEWHVEPEELIDAGDHVVTVVRDRGRMKDTGSEVTNRFAHVFTFRSGKVIRWKTFTRKEEALEAVGLRE